MNREQALALPRSPDWLRRADWEGDVSVSPRDCIVTFNSGVWKDGVWKDGVWKSGTWLNGYWWDGSWWDGVWENGKWGNGYWHDGTWKGGTFVNGEVINMTFMDDLFNEVPRLRGAVSSVTILDEFSGVGGVSTS